MNVTLDRQVVGSSSGLHYSRERLLEIFQQLWEKEQTILATGRHSSSWLRTFKRLQEAKSKSQVLSNIVLDEPIEQIVPVQKRVTNESKQLPTITIPMTNIQPISSFMHMAPRQKPDNNRDSTIMLEHTTQASHLVGERHASRWGLSKPSFNISSIPNREMSTSLGRVQFELNPPDSDPLFPCHLETRSHYFVNMTKKE